MRRTKQKLIALNILYLFIFSCAIKIPIKFISEDEYKITQEQNDKIKERILDELKKIDFGESEDPSPNDCRDAFVLWLKEKFDEGQVPKRNITAIEYSRGNARFHRCQTIDMNEEVATAFEELQGRGETRASFNVFNLSKTKEKLPESKCVDNFLDPKEERIDITKIMIDVENNSLNYKAPGTKVYYSTEILDEDVISAPNAETILREEGKIQLLATLPEVPPQFEGKLESKLVSKDELNKAKKVLTALKSQLIFYRNLTKPEEKTIGENTYFVVPQGELSMRIQVNFEILGKISDASCLWNEKKEKLREEDAKRKEEYYKKNQ